LFKVYAPSLGYLPMALVLIGVTLLVGAAALLSLEETYGRSLDFYEE
jgi:hypothetical protein